MSLIIATPGGSAQFLAGVVIADGVIAPGLTGQQDDFAPSGVAPSTLISLRPTADLTITGMQAAGAFAMRWLKNDSAFTVTIADQSASSSAANRFNCGGADVTVPAGMSVGFLYNGLTTRWDLFMSPAASGGAGAVTALAQAATFTTAAGANDDVTPVPAITAINRLKFDTAAGAATVTGIVAGADGQLLLATNIDPTQDLTLAVENAGSAAANRLYGAADLTLPPLNSQLLMYDAALTRWVIA